MDQSIPAIPGWRAGSVHDMEPCGVDKLTYEERKHLFGEEIVSLQIHRSWQISMELWSTQGLITCPVQSSVAKDKVHKKDQCMLPTGRWSKHH